METKFLSINGGKLAYRELGQGQPLILCNRFRGTLDTWDPLFLESLAAYFRVFTFDYPGIGYSTGTFPKDIHGLADVLKEFADGLNFKEAILAGWSFGGFVAQVAALQFNGFATHIVLIGSNPPGENAMTFEPVFLEHALIPYYNEQDEVILFFEPESPFSVRASKASHDRIYSRIDVDRIPVQKEVFDLYFEAGAHYREDVMGMRKKLMETQIPVLVLHGDHDVSFPIENWFPFLRQLKNGQLIVYTKAGHGPQHQLPVLSAKYITDFVHESSVIEL